MKEMGEIFEAGQGREFSGDVAYAAHLFPSWASVRNHPTVIYASTKRGERLRLLLLLLLREEERRVLPFGSLTRI